MRLWSIHPKYLDPQGLVACWREALLARAVLRNETRGYRNHPQIDRFRAAENPLASLEVYLWVLWEEEGHGAGIGSTRTSWASGCRLSVSQ